MIRKVGDTEILPVQRSNPNEYGYNVGCLEGVDPNNIANVPTSDGVNHSSDRRA